MIRRLLAMVTPDLVGLNGCCCYRRPFIYSSTHLLTHSPLIHHSPTHSRPLAHSLPHITHSSTQTTHLSTHPFVCAACVYCWHDVSVVLVVGSLVVWSRSSKEHTRFGNSLNVSWWWRKPPWCFQTKRFFFWMSGYDIVLESYAVVSTVIRHVSNIHKAPIPTSPLRCTLHPWDFASYREAWLVFCVLINNFFSTMWS